MSARRISRRTLASRLFVLILLTNVFVQTISTGMPFAQTFTPPSGSIPSSLFGLHIHRAATSTPWPNESFYSWRLWDTDTTWSDVEPSSGVWNFTLLDKLVNLASQHNVEVLLPIGVSPRWASARPNEKAAFGVGRAAEPASIEDWRTYVRTVALRYKGKVHYYEIWNEPNLTDFYTGSVENLVLLTKEAARILKDVDPSNRIVSPSATSNYGVNWVEKFLAAGGGRYVDVIGYHFYVTPKAPENMVPVMEKVRSIMSKYGINKPLWNTEAGWFIANRQNVVKPTLSGIKSKVLTDDEAVAYIARSYIIAWTMGIERFYWYAWDNHEMGLVEPDNRSPKSAVQAYKNIQSWLIGSKLTDCTSSADGTWVCSATGSDGSRSWIVWNTQKGTSFSLHSDWNPVLIKHLDGPDESVPSSRAVLIGPKPILLKERKTAN